MISSNHPEKSQALRVYTVRLSRRTIDDLHARARSRRVPSRALARAFIEAGLGCPFSDSEIQRLGLDS